MDDKPKFRILRLKEVQAMTGLSRSTIYDRVARGEFPSQINLGGSSVGWLEHEVIAWLRQQIAASRSANSRDAYGTARS